LPFLSAAFFPSGKASSRTIPTAGAFPYVRPLHFHRRRVRVSLGVGARADGRHHSDSAFPSSKGSFAFPFYPLFRFYHVLVHFKEEGTSATTTRQGKKRHTIRQGTTRHDTTGQGQGKARQGKARQGKARQDKTKQDRTGAEQDRTRQTTTGRSILELQTAIALLLSLQGVL
jgi:hypothetical protein